MAVVGGQITEITYNHPTLGTGRLFPPTSASATIDLGGIRVDDSDEGVDGGGRMIKQMRAKRWSVEVEVSNDMNNAKEAEAVNALMASSEDADWTFSHINGTIYTGKGCPVGDVQADAMEAKFTLKVAGGGKLGQL